MLIYYVAKDGKVERRLREEIEKYMQDDDYSYENLKKINTFLVLCATHQY